MNIKIINKFNECFERTHKKYFYPILQLGRSIIIIAKKDCQNQKKKKNHS